MGEIVDKICLKNQCAIVTGGHSGIGRGIVEAFAQAGANIVIVGRREALGQRVATQLAEDHGVDVRFIAADVTKSADRKRIVTQTVSAFGRIDVLVNNAGTTVDCPAEDYTEANWDLVVGLNLKALFFMSQEVGRVMIAQKAGAIVNISSNSDRVVQTPQKQVAYNASKSGVDMVTRCLAYEWAEHHIRVNAVAPGYTDTEILPRGQRKSDGKAFSEVWREMMPMGRFAKPEEIGGLTLFLASEMASFITGAVVLIDGGYTLV